MESECDEIDRSTVGSYNKLKFEMSKYTSNNKKLKMQQ